MFEWDACRFEEKNQAMEISGKKATIIVEGVFNEGYQKHFTEYSLKIKTLLQKHQTSVIRRQKVKEALYGYDKIDLIMVIDFEDEATAKSIFFEKEYLDIIPLRDKIFSQFKMYLAEFGNL